MKTYVVVEQAADAATIAAAMPAQVRDQVQIVVGGDRSSATSLARSLLATRNRPVLLVLNSDTTNDAAVAEQNGMWRSLLADVALTAPHDLVLAVPELESVYFQDPQALAGALHVPIEAADVANAAQAPRKTLAELRARQPLGAAGTPVESDAGLAAAMAQHPTMQRINAFLTAAVQQAE